MTCFSFILPVSPIILTFIGQLRCKIGSSVILPCKAVGIEPITYTWTRGRADSHSAISPTVDTHTDGELKRVILVIYLSISVIFNMKNIPRREGKKLFILLLMQQMELCIFPVCSTLMQGNITVLLRTEQDDIRDVQCSLSQVCQHQCITC